MDLAESMGEDWIVAQALQRMATPDAPIFAPKDPNAPSGYLATVIA